MSDAERGGAAETTSVEEQVAAGLRKLIDAHGHAFQYASLRRVQQVFSRSAEWHFIATELPVEVRRDSTRIDFVLKHAHQPLYLLVECKRANPKLARWAFARSPYVHYKRGDFEPYIAERVQRFGTELDVAGVPLTYLERAYHVGYELKVGNAQGDVAGTGRGAIEEAATQVSRSISGMVNFLAGNPDVIGKASSIMDVPEAVLMPAIFTTAEVWTTDTDLGAADLATGQLSGRVVVTRAAWLPLQYHLSPGVKHAHRPRSLAADVADIMDTEYIRTIAVVSVEGIAEFLRFASRLELR